MFLSVKTPHIKGNRRTTYRNFVLCAIRGLQLHNVNALASYLLINVFSCFTAVYSSKGVVIISYFHVLYIKKYSMPGTVCKKKKKRCKCNGKVQFFSISHTMSPDVNCLCSRQRWVHNGNAISLSLTPIYRAGISFVT